MNSKLLDFNTKFMDLKENSLEAHVKAKCLVEVTKLQQEHLAEVAKL
jgi:ribosome biogenesis protein Tsr3